jgi:nucleotide-binding universal stress UspA family protein
MSVSEADLGTMALRRILVATDFSAAARQAVWRAGQLAKQHDAYLHVVHARPDWNQFAPTAGMAPEHYRAITNECENALRDELTYLEKAFGLHARGETRVGRASQVLLSAIAQVEPHLVVVGARGEHDSRAMIPFLGGTALKLLHYADKPVLIVRTSGTGSYKTTVAAVEHPSPAARDLVRWARTLMGEGDCHIVHAFDAPYSERMRRHGVSEAAIRASSESVRADAKQFIEQMLDLESSGQRLHAHLVCGEPVSAVLSEVSRCAPEVIVVGKHGHPPREQLVRSLGSVALRIAYHATVDVLVVP